MDWDNFATGKKQISDLFAQRQKDMQDFSNEDFLQCPPEEKRAHLDAIMSNKKALYENLKNFATAVKTEQNCIESLSKAMQPHDLQEISNWERDIALKNKKVSDRSDKFLQMWRENQQKMEKWSGPKW